MKNGFFSDKNGKPMLLLGVQVNNSSTGSVTFDRELRAVKQFGGNLLEAPVYWGQIERNEGMYDFSMVKDLVLRCRHAGLYLIILWFASSKNGHPTYAPDYVKLHPETYVLAKAANGAPVPSLSPHCEASAQADARAFARLMAYLKEIDEKEGTVVAVQVENEAGLANTDRDYGPMAAADYAKGVPAVLDGIRLEDDGLEAISAGSTWRDRFGRHAHEAFTAWYHAVYAEKVARAGKAEYDLPMIVNVMVGEQGVEEAGWSYNSGAAVGRMLDIWKRGAPSIDILCPDIYSESRDAYHRICERYARADNPLLIPESHILGISNALYMMNAFADYGCIGFAAFGAHYALSSDGSLTQEAQLLATSMRAVMGVEPLILTYRNTGRIHSLIQQEFEKEQYIRLKHHHVHAKFFSSMPNEQYGLGSRINLHAEENRYLLQERGRALLIQTGDEEFYLSGTGVKVDFIRRPDPMDENPFPKLSSRQAGTLNFLRVEEGHFENGVWTVDYVRNGDEANFAVYVHGGQTVRIVLNPNRGL